MIINNKLCHSYNRYRIF